MKQIVFCYFVFFSLCVLFSQTSIIQDKSGETSLLINDKNMIFVNAGDASISFSLSYNNPTCFSGINFKLKAIEGISNIIDGYDFKPEIEVGLFFGKYLIGKKESTSHFIYSGLAFISSAFNILSASNNIDFQKNDFHGYALTVGYNRMSAYKLFCNKLQSLNGPYIFGISLNYGKFNNIDDLKGVQKFSIQLLTDSENKQYIFQKDKKSGFEGNYYTTNSVHLNVDTYIFPKILGKNIAIGGFLRSYLSGEKPRTNAGFGLLIGEKTAPTNVVLALLYQFNDIFNQLKEETDFIKRTSLNINVGYNF